VRSVLLVAALLSGSLGAAAALAAQAGSGTAAIETVRNAVAAGNLNDADREAASLQLDAAAADEAEADKLATQLVALRNEAATQPARMDQLRRALALDRDRALQEWAARLPRNADAETLERVLAQERSIIEGLSAQINQVAGELALILSGPAQAATDIAMLRQRADELAVPLPRVEGEPAVLADVKRVRRASELRRTQTELELRLLEQETATRRQSLNELTIGELRHRQGLHTARAEMLQKLIADLGRREIDSLLARLAEREEALAGSLGVVARTLSENHAFGRELTEQNEQLAVDRNALAANEDAKDHTGVSLRDSRARLDLGTSNEQVGRWLWSERRRLETPAQLQPRLDDVRSALADARLRLVTLMEERRRLIDIRAAAAAMATAQVEADEEASGQTVDPATLEPLLQDRSELLALLEPLYQRRIAALEQSEQALQSQLEDSRALQQLLDRHLLWISSHRPVDASWLQRIPTGLADLFKPSRYVTTFDLAQLYLRSNPLPWIGGVLLLIALLELRRRARRQIEAEAPVTRQIRKDNYLATARTLAWTVAAAAPVPFAVYLLGELLQVSGEPGRFSDSLGRALQSLTWLLLAAHVLWWTVIERGLGHAHFRWVRSRREALGRIVPLTALVVLPMYFVSRLAFNRNLDLSNDVEARLAIVIASLVLAWSLWFLLAAGRIWAVRGVNLEPSRLRRLLRVALPAGVIAIAVLALSGYVYSAGMLLRAVLATFAVVVAASIAFGLLGRWFLLGERRLAFMRLEERRAAAEAAGEQSEPSAESERELTLEQINAQTGRLLSALRLTITAAAIIWVWADLMPAFARLDEVALWHFAQTGPDGTETLQPVTLMAVVLGAVALMLTVVGARNLPGLIEIGLLSKTHIDAPSRYAITSILRYAIVITGTIIGLGLLGLRWSQLQWMAAALTVGLGFGLQEIFANFVSGLILLFERPFRVGDVITVGDLSGRVTKIRTRATTILDFENKEIVVPNKSFITGQLINWTLTDTTTRVTIKVGVDYGTDPQLVLDLLMRAARENELVLTEPEPQAWFLVFGANSLDFELRVFVANLGDRLVVQNALNIRITELFTEHGINIAFPQLDLHIRDLPAVFGSGTAPGGAQRPDQPPAPPAGA
jgi:potassium efflux system protein